MITAEEPSQGLETGNVTLEKMVDVDDSDNPTSSEKNEENRSNDRCVCLCVCVCVCEWRKKVVFGTQLI